MLRAVCKSIVLIVCVIFGRQSFSAETNYYCDVDQQHHFSLSRGTLNSSRLDSGSEVAFTREELNSRFVVSNDKFHSVAIDFNFQYTIFDFDNAIMPMTNGHLHTWDFPFNWNIYGGDNAVGYYLVPVISVSSNVLRNPDLLDREDLQLWTGIIYKKDFNKDKAWIMGFRSDHRFGRYRAYPVVGLCWQPSKDWQLQLVLPDFSIRRNFSNKIHLKLYVEPDGNQWHVFSKDKIRDSNFTYDAIVTGLSIEWRISSSIKLGLDAEKHSRRRFDFVLDDGSPIKTRARSSTGLTIRGEVVF